MIGAFVNPWDGRTWKILGIRPRRVQDGLSTEYDVVRLPYTFNTDEGQVEEVL